VVNIDPITVPTTRAAYVSGYVSGEMADIEVLGESVENVVVEDFKRLQVVSRIAQFGPLPPSVARRLTESLVPKAAPDKKLCTLGGSCVETCPAVAKAIEMVASKVVIDQGKCIRCYCCQEMCPSGAMKLRSGLLARLLNR
jgi:ferredoxin